ncbi:MAG: hypothetical protein AB7P40_20710 [Chloroflexota bacterium]
MFVSIPGAAGYAGLTCLPADGQRQLKATRVCMGTADRSDSGV